MDNNIKHDLAVIILGFAFWLVSFGFISYLEVCLAAEILHKLVPWGATAYYGITTWCVAALVLLVNSWGWWLRERNSTAERPVKWSVADYFKLGTPSLIFTFVVTAFAESLVATGFLPPM